MIAAQRFNEAHSSSSNNRGVTSFGNCAVSWTRRTAEVRNSSDLSMSLALVDSS